MFKPKLILSVFGLFLAAFVWAGGINGSPSSSLESEVADVCVKVRGNGESLVKIRVGPNNYSGACCTGISKETTVNVCGKSGYKVYDSETKRLLFVLDPALQGKVVDLREYY